MGGPVRPARVPWIAATHDAAYHHFRTNGACWLQPAYDGMKSRSCVVVRRIGTGDSAVPHPDPSGGQAPALHFLVAPTTIDLGFGTFGRWRATGSRLSGGHTLVTMDAKD